MPRSEIKDVDVVKVYKLNHLIVQFVLLTMLFLKYRTMTAVEVSIQEAERFHFICYVK